MEKTFDCEICHLNKPITERFVGVFARKVIDTVYSVEYQMCADCFVNGKNDGDAMNEIWESFSKNNLLL